MKFRFSCFLLFFFKPVLWTFLHQQVWQQLVQKQQIYFGTYSTHDWLSHSGNPGAGSLLWQDICTSTVPSSAWASAYPPRADRHTSSKQTQNRGAYSILVLWLPPSHCSSFFFFTVVDSGGFSKAWRVPVSLFLEKFLQHGAPGKMKNRISRQFLEQVES